MIVMSFLICSKNNLLKFIVNYCSKMYYGRVEKYPTYTSFTSYINDNDLSSIENTITNLLSEEKDFHLLPNCPYLAVNIDRLSRQCRFERPPLVIVAIAVGKNGWTTIRTYPNEWLFLRANGVRPRLSNIVMQLKCDAFYYRVICDSDNLLMEVNSKGDFRFDYTIYPQFSLLENITKEFVEIMELANKNTDRGYFTGEKCSGELITITLDKLINHSQHRWDTDDLYDMAYNNFRRFEQMNIRLLYFLPPDNYLETLPRYNDEPGDAYDLLSGQWYESPF